MTRGQISKVKRGDCTGIPLPVQIWRRTIRKSHTRSNIHKSWQGCWERSSVQTTRGWFKCARSPTRSPPGSERGAALHPGAMQAWPRSGTALVQEGQGGRTRGALGFAAHTVNNRRALQLPRDSRLPTDSPKAPDHQPKLSFCSGRHGLANRCWNGWERSVLRLHSRSINSHLQGRLEKAGTAPKSPQWMQGWGQLRGQDVEILWEMTGKDKQENSSAEFSKRCRFLLLPLPKMQWEIRSKSNESCLVFKPWNKNEHL